MPARPAHPRDKAKVENGVLLLQRWILVRLRNQTFFSLAMRRYGKSRRQQVRTSALTIEIFHRGQRVASHTRRYQRGGFTANPAHMPIGHRKHAEWTPERIASWAGRTGPHTRALAEAILAERKHPEHGYRACLGIMRLAERYGVARVEAACQRALAVGARSYRRVEAILRAGLDAAPMPVVDEPTAAPVEHENIRGPGYCR